MLGAAVRRVADDGLADHIDLNFGCPVPKVTRKGGGSALPWKIDLFRSLVAAAVNAADGRFPVTVKMRMGIDAAHLVSRRRPGGPGRRCGMGGAARSDGRAVLRRAGRLGGDRTVEGRAQHPRPGER